MKVTVLYVQDCPHARLAVDRDAAALDQLGIDAQVTQQLVATDKDAARLRFRQDHGSGL